MGNNVSLLVLQGTKELRHFLANPGEVVPRDKLTFFSLWSTSLRQMEDDRESLLVMERRVMSVAALLAVDTSEQWDTVSLWLLSTARS